MPSSVLVREEVSCFQRFLLLNQSTLVHFLVVQLLQQLIEPGMTSCAKDRQTALDCKGEGNAAFGRASFKHALDCYTKVCMESIKPCLILLPESACCFPLNMQFLLREGGFFSIQGLRFISLNTQVDASHAATLLVNRASSLHVNRQP